MGTDTTKRASRGGFTLIEVLIALVILAVGLLGLEALGIGAATMVNKARLESNHAAVATEHLETTLATARAGGTPTNYTTTVAGVGSVAVTVARANVGPRVRTDVTVVLTPQTRSWANSTPYRMVGSVLR